MWSPHLSPSRIPTKVFPVDDLPPTLVGTSVSRNLIDDPTHATTLTSTTPVFFPEGSPYAQDRST